MKWLIIASLGLIGVGLIGAMAYLGVFNAWIIGSVILTALIIGGYLADRRSARIRTKRKDIFAWIGTKSRAALRPLKELRWPTIDDPIGVGPIATTAITSGLAFITSALLAWILTRLAVWTGGIDAGSWLSFALWFLLSSGTTLLLLSSPRVHGPRQPVRKTKKGQEGPEIEIGDASKHMLPVPPNFAGIPLWLNSRFKRFFFKEGAYMVPWWLGFSVSTSPVSETKIQFHDTQGRPQPEENRGHFRPEEALGYVFIGKRTIQEVVLVQAADLVEVTADANAIIQVENPIKWQAADNPYGTVIGRLEASLRTAIARFHAEDANAVRSLFPSLLLGSVVLYLKARESKGAFVIGDLIRDPTGERIVHKTPLSRKTKKPTAKDKQAYLDMANKSADAACKPDGGFTLDMIQALEVSQEYLEELRAYGGAKKHMAIKDISLPKEIQDSAALVVKERREQVAEVIQAETAARVMEIHKQALDTHGTEAAEMAMIDREKGKLVVGRGENPIAQALAGFSKKGD